MSLQNLLTLYDHLQTKDIVYHTSPPTHPKRASVAAILRYKTYSSSSTVTKSVPTNFTEFIDSMNKVPGELELLFIQRATRENDIWSGHTALPGGKREANETDIDAAMREVKEEIGLDLHGPDFLYLGKLDDKKIIAMKNNELMMILVPFVFLQVVHVTPTLTLQPSEVHAVHWVGLNYLFSTPLVDYDPINRYTVDPNAKNFEYQDVVLPSLVLPTNETEPVILWGLTLRITQQLLEFTYSNYDIYSKSRL
ncbi:NUDIX hydrolase domain-like protein [Cunninghamella echinulata]|nr:NUDIX hydrolase domain-like protein [Cunninghamella echinulata]